MKIRDRIKEFRRVKAGLLRPHPNNWRTHPPAQRDALRGVLAEIGYAGALLARELPDGSLELIDGHLRAETTPDADVPVLILDLDEREAKKLLAVLDPLAAMAESNDEALAELLAHVETESDAVRAMLDEMLGNHDAPEGGAGLAGGTDRDIDVPEAFQVVVECRDENQQRAVFERLTGEGFECRLLTL
ncbi:MAG: hypothetical protein KKA28_12755 [Planctomycetes bacterium]|nr:hypothetical protein [Planctomycetota bacterium]MCG2685521.1 hypothetical protein [Planctomycetales bacterium]